MDYSLVSDKQLFGGQLSHAHSGDWASEGILQQNDGAARLPYNLRVTTQDGNFQRSYEVANGAPGKTLQIVNDPATGKQQYLETPLSKSEGITRKFEVALGNFQKESASFKPEPPAAPATKAEVTPEISIEFKQPTETRAMFGDGAHPEMLKPGFAQQYPLAKNSPPSVTVDTPRHKEAKPSTTRAHRAELKRTPLPPHKPVEPVAAAPGIKSDMTALADIPATGGSLGGTMGKVKSSFGVDAGDKLAKESFINRPMGSGFSM